MGDAIKFTLDGAEVEAAPEEVVEAEEAPVAVESPTQVVEAPAEPSEAEPAPVPATDSRSTDGKPALLDAPRAGGAEDWRGVGRTERRVHHARTTGRPTTPLGE